MTVGDFIAAGGIKQTKQKEVTCCFTSLLLSGRTREDEGDPGGQVHDGWSGTTAACQDCLLCLLGLYEMALASGKKASQYFISCGSRKRKR